MFTIARILVLCLSVCAVYGKFPPELTACARNDPNFQECVKKSTQAALKILRNGLSSPKLPPLDPLEIDRLSLESNSGALRFKEVLTNLKIYNIPDGEILESYVNMDNGTMYIKTRTEKLLVLSDYEVEGSILVVPIVGKGFGNSTFYNMASESQIKLEKYKKKDKEYLRIKEWNMNYKCERGEFYLSNLFNGNKALSDEMHRLINENWEVLSDEFNPVFSQALSIYFKDYANRFFSKIPYDELYPLK